MHDRVPILEVDDLVVDFRVGGGIFNAVRGVRFSLERHESIAIIGESGSGKSVTANAILGLIDMPPQIIRSGDIRFKGQSILSMPKAERRRLYGRNIAVVFQDPMTYLNPVYTVGWQIAEVCRIHGASRREAAARALELLEQVGIPDPTKRQHDYPHQFSGGQRQRVMIAMAMALKPDVLIADEPTTALDVTVQAQILDLLRKVQQDTGSSLILITHDLGVAADIAERVLVMKEGVFVEEGKTVDVFRAPKHPYTQKLLAARKDRFAGQPPADSGPIIEVEHVDVSYGSVTAVKDASLTLNRGEILCVVGESGSGKSSLASAILGLRTPTAGSIKFRSHDIQRLSGAERRDYRQSVQAVFQDPYSSLNPRLSTRDIIAEGWTIHKGLLPRDQWTARAGELMESVGLSASDLTKYPSEFSGGQRQRIAIARALALNPKVLVCDEAVSSLDMSVQAQVIGLLADLRNRLGLALIFITHDLTLVRNFADRVVVMRNAAVVEAGTPAELFDNPREAYTRQLMAASPVPDPELQAERRLAFQKLTAAALV